MRGIRPFQKALDLDLVAHLSLAQADHMTLVEHQQTNVIEQTGIIAQREIEFLGSCYNDVALPDRILIKAADANAAVEGRNGLAQRPKGSLERCLGLCRECAKRSYEYDPSTRSQTAKNAEFGNARLSGAS